MTELPEVAVWQHDGSNAWSLSGSIGSWESLTFAPTFLDDGDWEMTLPYDAQAQPLTSRGALVTVDFRGTRSTWRVVPRISVADDGTRSLTVAGPGALSLLGDETAWPQPDLPVDQQYDTEARPRLYTGPAETVVLSLVRENYTVRAGRPLHVPNGSGRGLDSRARSNFANLQELVVRKARAGGIGVDVGLVETTGPTRARLAVRVWEPDDKSGEVYLSELVGSLSEWGAEITPPELTEAIVSGAEGVYLRVTTPESEADAALWGGHRSALVSGPQSYDDEDLQQAGEEALVDGASKVDVSLTAADNEALVAFRDYTVGDRATAALEAGLEVVDVVSSIQVTVDGSGTEVVPTFGDPTMGDEYASLGQLIRSQDRRLRAQEQRG